MYPMTYKPSEVRCRLLLMALLLLLVSHAAWATTNTVRVLYVGRLSEDIAADTVLGRPAGARQWLPSSIHWGASSSATRFVYPDWNNLSGTVAIGDISDDGLTDLLLFVRGTLPTQPPRDTATVVFLYGNNGLKSVTTVTISTISAEQSEPFKAKLLVTGEHFVDHSKCVGTDIYRIDLGTEPQAKRSVSEPKEVAGSSQVHIYPNPTVREIRIEAEGLTSERCTLRLMSLGGDVVLEREMRAGGGQLSGLLDTGLVSSGTYILELMQDTGLVSRHCIIINR